MECSTNINFGTRTRAALNLNILHYGGLRMTVNVICILTLYLTSMSYANIFISILLIWDLNLALGLCLTRRP